jgi:hypothetical protein
MSEYRITHTEIPAQRTDYDEEGDQIEPQHTGLLIHIRPPVQLNPAAVQRHLEWSTLRPIDSDATAELFDVKDVVVLGSTDEQTTIYASIAQKFQGHVAPREKIEGIIQDTLRDTAEFLQFMGARAIVETMQTPDVGS